MMNVLDALRYRLGAIDFEGEPVSPGLAEAMGLRNGRPQRSLPPGTPPGLPLGVQDLLRNYGGYEEGKVMAPEPYWNPAMDRTEGQLYQQPGRPDRLVQGIEDADYLRRSGRYAWPEGGSPSLLEKGQSPFASPLNQLLLLGRQAPLSMY